MLLLLLIKPLANFIVWISNTASGSARLDAAQELSWGVNRNTNNRVD